MGLPMHRNREIRPSPVSVSVAVDPEDPLQLAEKLLITNDHLRVSKDKMKPNILKTIF